MNNGIKLSFFTNYTIRLFRYSKSISRHIPVKSTYNHATTHYPMRGLAKNQNTRQTIVHRGCCPYCPKFYPLHGACREHRRYRPPMCRCYMLWMRAFLSFFAGLVKVFIFVWGRKFHTNDSDGHRNGC